ncbi:hypothetical protein EDB86DRAFT_536340 [Lactarius hatsudake]|nr:hypothetical protein EDB86DRAFT_536340 [Lactarius hatsudake]
MASGSALTRAELDYRHANIDSSIQTYLTSSSQEHSVELFAAFIMATDIVVGLKPCAEFQRFWELVFRVKSISSPSFMNTTRTEWSGNCIIGPCVMCTIPGLCIAVLLLAHWCEFRRGGVEARARCPRPHSRPLNRSRWRCHWATRPQQVQRLRRPRT